MMFGLEMTEWMILHTTQVGWRVAGKGGSGGTEVEMDPLWVPSRPFAAFFQRVESLAEIAKNENYRIASLFKMQNKICCGDLTVSEPGRLVCLHHAAAHVCTRLGAHTGVKVCLPRLFSAQPTHEHTRTYIPTHTHNQCYMIEQTRRSS